MLIREFMRMPRTVRIIRMQVRIVRIATNYDIPQHCPSSASF